MTINSLIEKYKPKLSIRMLKFMAEQHPRRTFFIVQDFIKKFNKKKGTISRNLTQLFNDGLITREYTTQSYHFGPRVRYTITPEGIELIKELSD